MLNHVRSGMILQTFSSVIEQIEQILTRNHFRVVALLVMIAIILHPIRQCQSCLDELRAISESFSAAFRNHHTVDTISVKCFSLVEAQMKPRCRQPTYHSCITTPRTGARLGLAKFVTATFEVGCKQRVKLMITWKTEKMIYGVILSMIQFVCQMFLDP